MPTSKSASSPNTGDMIDREDAAPLLGEQAPQKPGTGTSQSGQSTDDPLKAPGGPPDRGAPGPGTPPPPPKPGEVVSIGGGKYLDGRLVGYVPREEAISATEGGIKDSTIQEGTGTVTDPIPEPPEPSPEDLKPSEGASSPAVPQSNPAVDAAPPAKPAPVAERS
jgi:hypothetical protein